MIEHNKSLKAYNTFGIDAVAKNFVSVTSVDELKEVLADPRFSEKFILGGGSNMVISNDIDALVIHINIKGISVVSEDEDSVFVKANAGEKWHDVVMYCISKDYGGIENMSLIPGNAGTAPIQNIGAYGVELKDVLLSCEAVSRKDFSIRTFTLEECRFGYRNSVFKNEEKGNYIITGIILRLTKKNHKLNTAYGDIQQELDKRQIKHPTIKDISDVVIAIRKSKLPEPGELGNSGSFFKNPVIDAPQFEAFIQKHPEAPFYKVSDDEIKIPAGWLIEKAGFKGKRFGNAGVHTKQALVLVNYGGATGQEIMKLARHIQQEVKNRFGITIEPEVNVVGL